MDNELEKDAKNKKTISILAVLVLILGLLLIGASVVMLNTHNSGKKEEPVEEKEEEKKEEEEEPKEEDKVNTSEYEYVDNSKDFDKTQKEVMNKLSSISDKDSVNIDVDKFNMIDPNTTDLDKLAKELINRYKRYDDTIGCESELTDIIGSGKTVTPKDINNKRANLIINNYILNNANIKQEYLEKLTEYIGNWYAPTKYRITRYDYVKAAKLLFGKDYVVKMVTYDSADLPSCLSLFYNTNTGKYIVFVPGGCGGSCSSPSKNFYEKYVGAEKVNDELVVTYNTSKKEDMSNPDTYKIHFAKNGNTYSFVKSEKVN